MHVFQKIRLEKFCSERGIDIQELDLSLTYDENMQLLEQFMTSEDKEDKWIKEYQSYLKTRGVTYRFSLANYALQLEHGL